MTEITTDNTKALINALERIEVLEAENAKQREDRTHLGKMLHDSRAERDALREAARNYRIAVHVWALMECAESAVPAMTEASNKLTELLGSGEGE